MTHTILALAPSALESYSPTPRGPAAQRVRYLAGGRAIVPVCGGLWPSDYVAIRADFDAALADQAASEIVLYVDSGGGHADGLADLTDHIFRSRGQKKITALVAGHAYSAAYILASAADRIVASRTAGLGSIAVLIVHMEMSRALDAAGVAVTQIASRSRKCEASPYLPLSDAAAERLQVDVDAADTVFAEIVARNRKIPIEAIAALDGITVTATEAVEARLADKIADLSLWLATEPKQSAPRDRMAAMAARIAAVPLPGRTVLPTHKEFIT